MVAPSAHSDPGFDAIGDLVRQVADLQQRVQNLEKRVGTAVEVPIAPVSTPAVATGFDLPPAILPVMGRMLVAIAGAYVLRALTEWGVLPAAAGVAMGLVYGLVWLGVAARSPVEAKFAAAMNCTTSVLIIAPLVWEATERLKVMTSAMSSGVLAAFALIALVLASKSGHRIVGTIAGASSMAMAVALLLARDDIVPFITALLVIAVATEFAAWRDLWPGARAVAALSADCSVLLFSWLMSEAYRMPETWVPASLFSVLAAQIGLAVIYITTAVVQTVARRRTLSFAEMAQTGAALLIGIGGAVWVFKEHPAIMLGLGIASLAGGMASYAVSFRLFERENKWNFRAWATFGLFLILAGIFLPFSHDAFWVLCCVYAMVCCWTARTFRLPTLGLHGMVYLAVGSAAAAVTSQPFRLIFGIGNGVVEWRTSIAVLVAGIMSWAAIAGISPDGPGRWRNQISSLAIAGHITWVTAGMVAYAALEMWRIAAGGDSGGPADTLVTLVLMGLSLGLAWVGTEWKRRELVWLLYGFMALGGYKLAIRDFRNEHNIALVVSLLSYGSMLILLPRMLRGKDAEPGQGHSHIRTKS
jgi:hypothetical protein